VVLTVFNSPRARRRLLWVGSLAAITGLVAAGIVLLPSSAKRPPVAHGQGPAKVVRIEQSVPMTAARRRAVDALLATFVPAAVERHEPLRALPLVTPAFRSGVTRDQWAHGNLPVLPFDSSNSHFPWTLGYSYANEISVDVLLHPSAKEELGAIAFTAVFKRQGRGWLIDSFVPAASFAPKKKAPRILAQPDFIPSMTTLDTKARLDPHWLLLPFALLALIVLVPVGIGVSKWRRSRRAWREYRAGYSR
jgi:hypothetical protein